MLRRKRAKELYRLTPDERDRQLPGIVLKALTHLAEEIEQIKARLQALEERR